MKKFIGMLKNWKTTVVGIVPLLISVLALTGVIQITPEDATGAVNGTFDAVIELLLAAVGLMGLFGRDADKSSEESGAKQ